jgi:hypothetical protein
MSGPSFTDLIINMSKATREALEKMDIQAVAKKYESKPEDVRFWRGHWRNLK